MPNLTITSQLSNDLMTFKSCGQGLPPGKKKVPIMEKPRRLWGLLHPPPIYPTVKESLYNPIEKENEVCDGSWTLVWSPGGCMEYGCVTSLDLLAVIWSVRWFL